MIVINFPPVTSFLWTMSAIWRTQHTKKYNKKERQWAETRLTFDVLSLDTWCLCLPRIVAYVIVTVKSHQCIHLTRLSPDYHRDIDAKTAGKEVLAGANNSTCTKASESFHQLCNMDTMLCNMHSRLQHPHIPNHATVLTLYLSLIWTSRGSCLAVTATSLHEGRSRLVERLRCSMSEEDRSNTDKQKDSSQRCTQPKNPDTIAPTRNVML